jgi:hypothetical protein
MEEVNFNFASNIEIHFPYSFLLETIKKNPWENVHDSKMFIKLSEDCLDMFLCIPGTTS